MHTFDSTDTTIIPLMLENGTYFHINFPLLNDKVTEIEQFLEQNSYMNQPNYAAKVIFPFDIKMNNAIEGYLDNLDSIYHAMDLHSRSNRKTKKLQENRIYNLCMGYQMIFDKPDITQANLRKLYHILSKNILVKSEQIGGAQLYRDAPVYIFYSSVGHKEPDMGLRETMVQKHMDDLFFYINQEENMNSVYSFIKSQIIHFYFVYVHPYFDINGRTSRTLSTWYLLKQDNYAFTLCNRHIPFTIQEYYKIIRDTKKTHDLTPFVEYMLKGVLHEMKKEKTIHDIEEGFQMVLSDLEKQTIFYIQSMKTNITVKSFATIYNQFNPKIKVHMIYQNMIMPLLEKGIIIKGNDTTTHLNTRESNFFFSLACPTLEKEKQKHL